MTPRSDGPTRHLVVSGVSGVGKTTLAARIAHRLGWTFGDADDFHPPRNLARMAAGRPLRDADREPWLDALASWMADHHAAGRSTVLACSALKRRYRDRLRSAAPRVVFLQLAAGREVLHERMTHRDHPMPVSLLDSQLQDLEPIGPDEAGVRLDASRSLDALLHEALHAIGCSQGERF